jgi:PTS system nitrogen regulatory IIA component
VDFDASDGQPVDLVFAMAVPEHFTQQHLQLLAELAEQFADAGFRDALRAAPDVGTLRALLLSAQQFDAAISP